MAYTNATFFLDYDLGSDAARTALTSVAVANNGSGLVRCTKAAHGLVTGAVVDVTLNYAGAWKIAVIDASNFDLIGSAYSTATAATVTPRGGSSKADAWKTMDIGASNARLAAGDTIRIKKSPDPTSLGMTGKWTDGPYKGANNIASSTNTTPITLALSTTNYNILAPVVGDTIIVSGHTTNTNANGVWTISAINGSTTITLQDALGVDSVGNGAGGGVGLIRKINNAVVTLAAPLTKNIAVCGNQGQKPNWTALADITTSVDTTTFKEGGECLFISIAAAFTTGLAAYFPTGLLDLSGYQQVSFWMQLNSSGSTGGLSLRLCTDAAGAVPVHTISLPYTSQTTVWNPVVVDLGGPLNSAIQSIALYVDADSGARNIRFDNIIACKASSAADSLNLTSLISKNTGSEGWFGIQSISGTRVMLDLVTASKPDSTPQRGYSGTTETVTTYKRETIKTAMATTSATVGRLQRTGLISTRMSYLGGWDATTMTTQTGETWFDGQNGVGIGLGDAGAGINYLTLDKINLARYAQGLQLQNASSCCQIGSMAVSNCGVALTIGAFGTATTLTSVQCNGALTTGSGSVVDTIARCDGGAGIITGSNSTVHNIVQANNNSGAGVTSGINSTIGVIVAAHGNGTTGYFPGSNSVCGSLTANYNTQYGVNYANTSFGSKILSGSTTGNISGSGVNTAGGVGALRNFTVNEATRVTSPTLWVGGTVFSENTDGVADSHIITSDGGTIVSATDQRNTASGISWKFRPTTTARDAMYPLPLSVAKIACAANAAVNVTIYTRRDSTNIVGTLKVRGGQIAGVAADVTVACTPTINTWVQSGALTFTPTEAGVVEVMFEAYDGVGTTNSFWVDDLAVT